MDTELSMTIRYLTDEAGERVGALLDIEEYERLRQIDEDMEDLEALQAARRAKSAIELGEEEVISWEEAMRAIREGKVASI
jgi:hypothetical protein